MTKTKGQPTDGSMFDALYNVKSKDGFNKLRTDLFNAISQHQNDGVKIMSRLLLKNTEEKAQNLHVFYRHFPETMNREEICEFLNSYNTLPEDRCALRKGFSSMGKADANKRVSKRFDARKPRASE